MPKKRPVKKSDCDRIADLVHEGYSKMLEIRSVLGGYLKQDNHVMCRIQNIVKDFKNFQQECRAELNLKAKD